MLERFDGIAPVGMQIYFYPGGKIGPNPINGFVKRGWDLGVADLQVMPIDDGAIRDPDGVFHVSDPRARDSFGVLSEAATKKGLWDFTPWSKSHLDSVEPDAIWPPKKHKTVGGRAKKAAVVEAK